MYSISGEFGVCLVLLLFMFVCFGGRTSPMKSPRATVLNLKVFVFHYVCAMCMYVMCIAGEFGVCLVVVSFMFVCFGLQRAVGANNSLMKLQSATVLLYIIDGNSPPPTPLWYSSGGAGLPDGTISVLLRGHTGQSFGFTLAKGVTLEVQGDANDGCGKVPFYI